MFLALIVLKEKKNWSLFWETSRSARRQQACGGGEKGLFEIVNAQETPALPEAMQGGQRRGAPAQCVQQDSGKG